MRILIASSGFKESLSSEEVASCIKDGILRVEPGAQVDLMPLIDGGEGFASAMVKATGGELLSAKVSGPVGQIVQAEYGFLGNTEKKTAVIDMASAAGLKLVPHDLRNPLVTSTRGVGQLIRLAVKQGAESILVGLGDSGTMDGGTGMAAELGVKFLDRSGNYIPDGGLGLADLHSIDASGLDGAIKQIPIHVACNMSNVLCGPKGVAHTFGHQKGASSEDIQFLSQAFDNYSSILLKELGAEVRLIPGGGASGGLGAGLFGVLGAHLHSRFDIIEKYFPIEDKIKSADLVITAEGAIDFQTNIGKIPGYIGVKAKQYGKPVIALVGTIGDGANENYNFGIDYFTSMIPRPMGLSEAIRDARSLLTDCSERTMRALRVGRALYEDAQESKAV